ncbi:MAG: hypothetical protein HRU09_12600 [Oligoflexales bacterium]|nr:hypothetical protein [Oligoflexales bacterium]
MEVALNGPEKVLYANGHHFKFTPVEWQVEEDQLVIRGKIGLEYKKYLLFKRYHDLCFELRIDQNYEIVDEQYENCSGEEYPESEWLMRAKEVVQDISLEAAARHLQPPEEA